LGIRINAPPDEEEVQKIQRPKKKIPTEFTVPTVDLAKTEILGVGLQEGKVKSGNNTTFDITPYDNEGKKLGKTTDKWDVNIKDPYENSIPFDLIENEDGTITVSYQPLNSGKHEIEITCYYFFNF
jgi:hypothetical protein